MVVLLFSVTKVTNCNCDCYKFGKRKDYISSSGNLKQDVFGRSHKFVKISTLEICL